MDAAERGLTLPERRRLGSNQAAGRVERVSEGRGDGNQSQLPVALLTDEKNVRRPPSSFATRRPPHTVYRLALATVGFALGIALLDGLRSFRGTAAVVVGSIAFEFKTSV